MHVTATQLEMAEKLRQVINENPGSIFRVKFIRRTTRKDGSAAAGESREMVCRTRVKKYLQGGELKYDPIEKGLLPVFDMEVAKALPEDQRNKAYRSIPLDAVEEITLNGVTYTKEDSNG